MKFFLKSNVDNHYSDPNVKSNDLFNVVKLRGQTIDDYVLNKIYQDQICNWA